MRSGANRYRGFAGRPNSVDEIIGFSGDYKADAAMGYRKNTFSRINGSDALVKKYLVLTAFDVPRAFYHPIQMSLVIVIVIVLALL